MEIPAAGTQAGTAMRLSVRHLRLASGLILLTYISLHLVNHALGIWSLDLAESGLTWSMRLWHSVFGTVLLYGAAGLHFALALRTVYQRRHWRLPAIEWVRLWAGFSLPLLLIGHVVTTRIAASFYHFEPNYQKVVASLIMAGAGAQCWQLALLAPGWLHGCLGLWLSLRRYAPMRRAKPALIGLVALVPLLSALGFVQMSHAVATKNAVAVLRSPDPGATARRMALEQWRHDLMRTYLGLIVGAFVAGQLRERFDRRRASDGA